MTTQTVITTKWNVDGAHSEIQFKARHLMITNVTGSFTNFEGTVETEGDDFTTAKINFSADTNSISTGSEQRDGHLKGEDFFAAEKFPKMTFASTSVEKTADDEFILHGDLTIRDVTKPVILDVQALGTAIDPWGNLKSGFSIEGKINRKDWGLNWNAALEAGGVLVSEEVKINCSVQLVKA